jgi:hypothetical protein
MMLNWSALRDQLPGGFLCAFLDEAIAEGLADEDKSGTVTAIELSQYVRTQGPQSGYQHLVIDRGSVGPFDVLFER